MEDKTLWGGGLGGGGWQLDFACSVLCFDSELCKQHRQVCNQCYLCSLCNIDIRVISVNYTLSVA